MNEKYNEHMAHDLEVIKNLLAYQVARSCDTLLDRVVALAAAGMKQGEIAAICGTTPGSISVRLAEAKRKKRKR